jgi:hypothetical protein
MKTHSNPFPATESSSDARSLQLAIKMIQPAIIAIAFGRVDAEPAWFHSCVAGQIVDSVVTA